MSGNKDAKFGNDWTSKLYFEGKEFTAEELIDDRLEQEMGDSVYENIKRIIVYKVPLADWQSTDEILYDNFLHHNFVLIETHNGWWWTIEKNSQGITIQKSKTRTDVTKLFRGNERDTRISAEAEGTSTKTMKDLLEWLYKENELNKSYHVLKSNCQHFAEAVFRGIAR